MAVQLRSGKEMSNSRAEEKATIGDNGRSKIEKITETEKQVQTEQPEKSCE